MPGILSRLLLAGSAAILLLGSAMHASAFGRTVDAVAASNLPPFFGGALKALWLIDSATLLLLAATFGVVAARPRNAGGAVVLLLALIPAATAILLYRFIGVTFFPAHMLLGAAALAALGGWLMMR